VAAAYNWGCAPGIERELRGVEIVAEAFKGRARGAQMAFLDGEPGAVWAPGGQLRGAFVFTVRDGRIVAIELVMAADHLGALEIEIVGRAGASPSCKGLNALAG
jgi:RNA polymerase sigma-70 factor (ECF subfamily)